MRILVRLIAALPLLYLSIGLPASTSANASTVFLPGFPTLKQQHSLTCESSAASMATRGAVPESRLMASMPRDLNPNLGFRGNPNGLQGKKLIDYGVYAAPVHRALLRFGHRSNVLLYATDNQIASYLDRGWPVVAWVTYALQPAMPRLVRAEGTQFFLVPHEHAVLIVGYDDSSVIANDPWTGKRVTYRWARFNRSWGLFARMALAIEPCAEPAGIAGLTVTSLSASGITWSWDAAANASRYDVQVTRKGNPDHIVFSGLQRQRRYTLLSPARGVAYEIAVRSISACGSVSASTRLFVEIPGNLPTPIITPSPTPTPPVQRGLTPTVGPTASPIAGTPSTPVTLSPTPTPTP